MTGSSSRRRGRGRLGSSHGRRSPPAEQERGGDGGQHQARAPDEIPAKRTGRRPGTTVTRDVIRDTAGQAFREAGYSTTSVRGVARRADVDPALVLHFFGSKAGLFIAAVGWPFDPREELHEVLSEGRDHIGGKLVRLFVEHWDNEQTRSPIVAMLHVATGDPAGARLMREFLEEQMLMPLIAAVDAEQPGLRAGLIAAQLLGLGTARYVLAFEPLASAPPETVIAPVAATVQRLLTDPLA